MALAASILALHGFIAQSSPVVPVGGTSAVARNIRAGSCDARWVPTFGAEPGLYGAMSLESSVFALAKFERNGQRLLIAGGEFSYVGNVSAKHIAAWNGTSWSRLGTGMNRAVHALITFDDGHGAGPLLYAGGDFSSAGGANARSLARWDGTSWSAFGNTDGSVDALCVFDDGSGPALYAGGNFTTLGQVPNHGLARWDGTTWSEVGGGVAGGFFVPAVRALCVFDDGHGPALYVGGEFTSAGGVPANYIAKWDGTSWSSLGSGVDDGGTPVVYALATFDDGHGPALFAGGDFQQVGGVTVNHVARWDGTSWSPLHRGPNTGVSSNVRSLGVLDEPGVPPRLFVSAESIGMFQWTGTNLETVADSSTLSPVALAQFDDGSPGGEALYVGGTFRNAGGMPTPCIARWDDGWSSLGTGLDGDVLAAEFFDDGRGGGTALYVGGNFTGAGGMPARSIARWNGASWSPVEGSHFELGVNALTVFDDGTGPALVAGAYEGPLRWNGTAWSPLGTEMNASVYAFTTFDDGLGGGPALYTGGLRTMTTHGIGKWDGAHWRALGPGLTSSSGYPVRVYSLAVFDDGTGPALFAAGEFGFAGATYLGNIAKWNGVSWSPLGDGLQFGANCLAVFDDHRGRGPALYASGFFQNIGGVVVNQIAKWDGVSWSPLGSGLWPATSAAFAMCVHDDGNGPALYVGGSFLRAGGVTVNGTARWDGVKWSALDHGIVAGSVELLKSRGTTLCVGGDFPTTIDSGDSFLGRWEGCDTTAPTLHCPPQVVETDSVTGPPGEIVTFTVTALDESDLLPTVACVPPSGSFFPRGTTTVHCPATDAAGNQSTAQFPVVVEPTFRRR